MLSVVISHVADNAIWLDSAATSAGMAPHRLFESSLNSVATPVISPISVGMLDVNLLVYKRR